MCISGHIWIFAQITAALRSTYVISMEYLRRISVFSQGGGVGELVRVGTGSRVGDKFSTLRETSGFASSLLLYLAVIDIIINILTDYQV